MSDTSATKNAILDIHQFPCLSDNYGYLIHDPETGQTASIDTPDATEILRQLSVKGWQLTHIFNTHHHMDHTGGNLELKEKTGCQIFGPRAENARIPGLEKAVGDGDFVALGAVKAQVFDVPGHTAGHIAYWFEGANAAFVGDTLFALGCGRLFEGTAEQMWASLSKLARLPGATKVYCAHEYTQANAKFALSVEPGNKDLQTRSREIDAARAAGRPTVPTTIDLELATNPFLRPSSENLQSTIGMVGASDVDIFAKTRQLKDNF